MKTEFEYRYETYVKYQSRGNSKIPYYYSDMLIADYLNLDFTHFFCLYDQ